MRRVHHSLIVLDRRFWWSFTLWLMALVCCHIIANSTIRANPIELLWFLIGLAGGLLDGFMLYDLWRDSGRLRTNKINGLARHTIDTTIGINVLVSGAHIGIMLTGAVAAGIPPATTTITHVTPTQIAITLGFVLIGIFTAGCSLWLRYRRNDFIILLRQHENPQQQEATA